MQNFSQKSWRNNIITSEISGQTGAQINIKAGHNSHKHEIPLNNILEFGSHLTRNTLRLTCIH
jgi:hypothetical protein